MYIIGMGRIRDCLVIVSFDYHAILAVEWHVVRIL